MNRYGVFPTLHTKAYSYWLWPMVVGALFLGVPLIQHLHFEFSFVAALCLSFLGMHTGLSGHYSDKQTLISLLGVLLLGSIPVALSSLVHGCLSTQGLGFWLAYPIPSLFFSYALGRFIRLRFSTHRSTLGWFFFVWIALAVPLMEFFHFPQLFFHNHLWGGWPGPLYDEELLLTKATWFFRIITLSWTGFLWCLPANPSLKAEHSLLWISIVSLIIGYGGLVRTNILIPDAQRQSALGGVHHTPHFSLYFAQAHYSTAEIHYWATQLEFYFEELLPSLPFENQRPIEVYMYAHPWQKQHLTGAKFTSYVPVWLTRHQLHVDKQSISSVLKHELTHVMAKPHSSSLINAPWQIGFTEGLAVALDGGQSQTNTLDQLAAALQPRPSASELQNMFSFTGFYGGRGRTNYTISGAFFSYLFSTYSAAQVRTFYGGTAPEVAFGVNWEELTHQWHRHLDTVRLDSTVKRQAQRVFSELSVFEKTCPHTLPLALQVHDRYEHLLANGDTLSALTLVLPHIGSYDERWSPFVMGYITTALDADLLSLFEGRLPEAWKPLLDIREADAELLRTKQAPSLPQVSSEDSLTHRWLTQAYTLRSDELEWQKALFIRYRPMRWSSLPITHYSTVELLQLAQQLFEKDAFDEAHRVAQHISSEVVRPAHIPLLLRIIPQLTYHVPEFPVEKWLYRASEVARREREHELLYEQTRYVRWLRGKQASWQTDQPND